MKNWRRIGHAEEQRRARGGVDDAVPGIKRWRKEAALLPLEGLLLVTIAVVPDLRRAAPLDHVENLLVHVLFRSNHASTGHLDNTHPLKPAAAVKLDERALCAHALPRRQSQIAHVVKPHRAAMDRQILLVHEKLVGRGWPYPAFCTDKILRHASLPPLIIRFALLRTGTVKAFLTRADRELRLYKTDMPLGSSMQAKDSLLEFSWATAS